MVDTLPPHSVTGVVLAGGQGSRMGGLDKGLQPLHGQPLAWHALQRLRQQGPLLAGCVVSANRHLADYAQWGVPVVADSLADFPGPLAGMLAGLAQAATPHVLTVPCDSPYFPLDLLPRLAAVLAHQQADIATASAPDEHGQLRKQPVFSLLKTELQGSLQRFLDEGGRKVGAWTAQHRQVLVPFDRPTDRPQAFYNVNTLADLQALEHLVP